MRAFFRAFFLILTIATTLLFAWIEYLSPDALYMRDNALYIAHRMHDTGILEDQPNSVLYHLAPLPVNMNRLLVSAEGWTTGYVKAAIASGDSAVNRKETRTNPYDTLSRLELKANMDDTQAVYDDVVYCQGVCAPDFPLDGSTASVWSMQTSKFQAAKKACASEGQVFILLFLLLSFSSGCNWYAWQGGIISRDWMAGLKSAWGRR